MSARDWQWVDLGNGRKKFKMINPRPLGVRSDLPAPNFILDGAEPFKSMADGKIYDSKSTYYESLKREGCRIVEPGEPS